MVLNKIFVFNIFTDLPEFLTYIVAVLSSIASGFLIGREREKAGKPAGLRTFALVSLGSTLFTLVSKEFGGHEETARVVGQIVSGVGFIGAGAVFYDKNRVSGLTTAAGIWVTAAIGVIYGLGFLPFGIIITVLVLLLFYYQPIFEKWVIGKCEYKEMKILYEDNSGKNYYQLLACTEPSDRFSMNFSADHSDPETKILNISYCARHRNHHLSLFEYSKLGFIKEMKKN